MRLYAEHDLDKYPALLHCRITTRGDSSAANTHPFETEHGALVHNGTIFGLGQRGAGESDSSIFAKMIGAAPREALGRMRPIIDDYLDDSRVAMLFHDGEFLVFNEREWDTEDNVMYSNLYFKRSFWMSDGFEIGSPSTAATYLDYADVPFFEWDQGMLFVENEQGVLLRDMALEDAVYAEWFADSDNQMCWPTTEDELAIDDITIDLLHQRQQLTIGDNHEHFPHHPSYA